MNKFEILQNWPSWKGATSEAIYGSPAWAMPGRWGDSEVRLRRTDTVFRDVLAITIRLDDDEHCLGLGNRETFPDLQKLWDVKNDLPEALKLALVEKECGQLLQLLENATKRQLTIVGVAPSAARQDATGFEVVDGGGTILASFNLDVTPGLIGTFGQFKYLDVNHEAIRSLTRDAWVVYASFSLPEKDVAELAIGDCLLLPEVASGKARWQTALPQDNFLTIATAEPSALTFAQFADEQLPPVPTPEVLRVYRQGRAIAQGRLEDIAGQPAVVLEEIY